MDFDETMAVTEYDWKSSVIQNGGALEIFWKAKLGATACQCLILQIFSFNSKKKTKQDKIPTVLSQSVITMEVSWLKLSRLDWVSLSTNCERIDHSRKYHNIP